MRELLKRIEEAKSKDPYAAIAKMTDYNDHGGAIFAGANLIGAKSIAKRVELVMKIHEIEGGMPYDLMKYRTSLYKELMGLAKKKLSKDDFEKFHGAF